MTYEHRILEAELGADFDYVVGVAGEARIFGPVVGRQVGVARADVVENNCHEVFFERGGHEPPHVLVTAEAMREDHCAIAGAANVDVVPFDYACHHKLSLSSTCNPSALAWPRPGCGF